MYYNYAPTYVHNFNTIQRRSYGRFNYYFPVTRSRLDIIRQTARWSSSNQIRISFVSKQFYYKIQTGDPPVASHTSFPFLQAYSILVCVPTSLWFSPSFRYSYFLGKFLFPKEFTNLTLRDVNGADLCQLPLDYQLLSCFRFHTNFPFYMQKHSEMYPQQLT